MKFAYLGQNYNGLEHHANNKTPLPTVEEVLWKALVKACLIFPTPVPGLGEEEVNWEGCEYSKCGRTDKGVSAFGQVVGLRVRSNRPLARQKESRMEQPNARDTWQNDSAILEDDHSTSLAIHPQDDGMADSSVTSGISSDDKPSFDPIRNEINYPQALNRLLPPDIKVLAWCGELPKDFSARFSCRGRGYKYFFTQPAFSPTAGSEGYSRFEQKKRPKSRREGWLDIEAMQAAARSFEGLHDFRNFCKIDPSKQIENYERRIYRSSIDELEPHHGPMNYLREAQFSEYKGQFRDIGAPAPGYKVYMFTLFGSAFLWHQVRHMMAILFLIGQGLESPCLVDELLDVKKHPQRPQYEMADDAPLVLWDCVFPKENTDSPEPHDALRWVYAGDEVNSTSEYSRKRGHNRYGSGDLGDQMWKVWRQRKIDELLAGTLLDVTLSKGSRFRSYADEQSQRDNIRGSQKLFTGGNSARLVGRYIPVLNKPRMERVEVINARYTTRKEMKDRIVGKIGSNGVNMHSLDHTTIANK